MMIPGILHALHAELLDSGMGAALGATPNETAGLFAAILAEFHGQSAVGAMPAVDGADEAGAVTWLQQLVAALEEEGNPALAELLADPGVFAALTATSGGSLPAGDERAWTPEQQAIWDAVVKDPAARADVIAALERMAADAGHVAQSATKGISAETSTVGIPVSRPETPAAVADPGTKQPASDAVPVPVNDAGQRSGLPRGEAVFRPFLVRGLEPLNASGTAQSPQAGAAAVDASAASTANRTPSVLAPVAATAAIVEADGLVRDWSVRFAPLLVNHANAKADTAPRERSLIALLRGELSANLALETPEAAIMIRGATVVQSTTPLLDQRALASLRPAPDPLPAPVFEPVPASGTSQPIAQGPAESPPRSGEVTGSAPATTRSEAPPTERPTLHNVGAFTVRSVRHLVQTGETTMRVRLVPEHLGELQLMVRSVGDKVHVQIASAHHAVREALEAQLAGLREHLARDGLEVARVSVTSDSPSNGHQTPAFGGRNPGAFDQGDKSMHPWRWRPDTANAGADHPPWAAPFAPGYHDGALNVVA